MCLGVLPACVLSLKRQKEGSVTLHLDLQGVVSRHVGAQNQILIFCKKSHCL